MVQKVSKNETQVHYTSFIILSILASLCLIIANSAFWFNRYIFNSTNFTNLAMSAITTTSSRDAIATEITDRMLQNRPILKNVIDDQVIKVIGGLLDSDRVQGLMKNSIMRLQTVITSQKPSAVAIDLTGVKTALTLLSSISERVAGNNSPDLQIQPSNIPDKIVLIDPSKLPNIYDLGIALLWLGPLAFVAALILLTIPIFQTYKKRRVLMNVFLIEGGIIIIGSLLGFLVGPLFKPMILAQIQSINLRVVVANLYETFIQTFNQQTIYLVVFGCLFLIAAIVTMLLNKNNIKKTASA